MPPLALSDEMLDRVMAAASLPLATSGNAFLKSVAGRVAGVPCVGMAEIEQANPFVLNNYGIIGGNQAFTNNRSKTR